MKEYAGQGAAIGSELVGSAGYKELVDFREIVDEYRGPKSSTLLPTTRGIIHYDKAGGAHIVPAYPHIE